MDARKDCFMVDVKSQGFGSLLKSHQILRALAIVFTAASIAIMVTNTQTVSVFMIQFQARYTYSSAFKFLVGAEGVVCGFSVVTFIILHLLHKRQSHFNIRYYFFLFLHDIVMTVVMMGGCAAATAIGYVGEYGESHMGWDALCGRVGKFCRGTIVSLLFSYLAFLSYFALTLLTPYYSFTSKSNPHT